MTGTLRQTDDGQTTRPQTDARRVIRDLSRVFGLLLAACALVLCLAPLSLAFAETAPSLKAPTQTGPAQSAPRLTQTEQDSLAASVERCWNVAALSSAAQQATIAVAVTIGPDKKPVATSIVVTHSNADADSTRQAFEAARRAILRCGYSGLPLPDGKEAAWRRLELIFGKGRINS